MNFIVEAFKMIFEYSKIDYDRVDKNYYDLLYSDNGYGLYGQTKINKFIRNC